MSDKDLSQFTDMDALMNAAMDDLPDLPPYGVPPSGHYNFEVTVALEDNKDKTGQYFAWNYEVTAINEVKEEPGDEPVKVGTKFMEPISPFKKDKTVNEFGVGVLKERVAPYAAHFGTAGIGETVRMIDKVTIAAELVRRPDRNDPERHRFSLKNVVVL